MEKGRRRILQWGVAATAALAVPPATLIAASQAFAAAPAVEAPLDYADFLALRGTWFFFSNPETAEAGKVRLVSVVSMTTEEGVEQFRLRFRPRRGLSLPSGLYDASNWDGHPEFQVYADLSPGRRGGSYLNAYFALLK